VKKLNCRFVVAELVKTCDELVTEHKTKKNSEEAAAEQRSHRDFKNLTLFFTKFQGPIKKRLKRLGLILPPLLSIAGTDVTSKEIQYKSDWYRFTLISFNSTPALRTSYRESVEPNFLSPSDLAKLNSFSTKHI
jgi:hypothetical protein